MHKTSINGLYRLFVAFKLPYFVKRTYNAPVKVVFCQFEKFGFLQILVQNSCSKPILVIKSLYLGVGGMSNFFFGRLQILLGPILYEMICGIDLKTAKKW